jgi:hypothetical protein
MVSPLEVCRLQSTRPGIGLIGPMPEHLVIIGGSYVGLEFAQIYIDPPLGPAGTTERQVRERSEPASDVFTKQPPAHPRCWRLLQRYCR